MLRWSLLTKQRALRVILPLCSHCVRRGAAPNPALSAEAVCREGDCSPPPFTAWRLPTDLGRRSARPQDPIAPGEVVPHSSPTPYCSRSHAGPRGMPSQHSPKISRSLFARRVRSCLRASCDAQVRPNPPEPNEKREAELRVITAIKKELSCSIPIPQTLSTPPSGKIT